MERVGFMTYTAASHQGAIKMLWIHFLRCVHHTWSWQWKRSIL